MLNHPWVVLDAAKTWRYVMLILYHLEQPSGPFRALPASHNARLNGPLHGCGYWLPRLMIGTAQACKTIGGWKKELPQ